MYTEFDIDSLRYNVKTKVYTGEYNHVAHVMMCMGAGLGYRVGFIPPERYLDMCIMIYMYMK